LQTINPIPLPCLVYCLISVYKVHIAFQSYVLCINRTQKLLITYLFTYILACVLTYLLTYYLLNYLLTYYLLTYLLTYLFAYLFTYLLLT